MDNNCATENELLAGKAFIDAISRGGLIKPSDLVHVVCMHASDLFRFIRNDESLKKECTDLARFLLKLLLHAADISNPTKELDLAKYWAENALAEFFAQGKRLRALTTSLHSLLVILPQSFLISPLSNLLYL